MNTILILGATSGIAEAFSRKALEKGYGVILASRNPDRLERVARDLEVRFGKDSIPRMEFDSLKPDTHAAFIEELEKRFPRIDGVLIACGIMPDQETCLEEFNQCREMMECNYVGLVSIMNRLAAFFERRNPGFISCITSVAGDRGRASNFLYGSTKAALDVYLGGLRNRLFKKGILVQTVKPGPVKTRMTEGMEDLPLMVPPERAAGDILLALERGRDVVYTPGIWKLIMAVIRAIPEGIFKRLSL
jgi:short-subunit dehydrogenase